MRRESISLALLAFLLLFAVLCVALNRPPAPRDASAPAADFSAERAMAHEFSMAQKPHPAGSAEHDRVRDYIVSEFTRLGLTPQVQRATGVTRLYQAAGSVENIIARLPGTAGRPDAVLLAAHYDSVAAGPGAGDDAAGVAALLETLRALRAGSPLQNDIIFLIPDGEEDGLLGASAFLAEHPSVRDVRLAINFEARGNAGASQMFETSRGNGALIDTLAKSVPHPSSSSLTYEIYKRMPNDTDMSIFKKAGIPLLNFGFIGHWEAYHSPLDTPQNLNRGSLQQHGEAALSLARAFGNADLSRLAAEDAVYFTLLGRWFIHYPRGWVWPVAGAVLALVLAASFYAGGTGDASFRGIGKGFLFTFAGVVLLGLIGYGGVTLLGWLHRHRLQDGNVLQNPFYLLALVALLATLWMMAFRFLRKKLFVGNLILGGALLLFLASLLAAIWIPGGSYVFEWPAAALLLAVFFVSPPRPDSPSLAHAIVVGLLSLPALLLVVPLVQGFYEALGLSALGAPVIAFVLAILFLALAPAIEMILAPRPISLVLAMLLATVLFVVWGMVTAPYSTAHPKPSIMAYALDADAGKAYWASSAARADAWIAQYVGANPSRGRLSGFYPDWIPLQFLQHEAPVLPLPAPEVQLVSSSIPAPGARTMVFNVKSPRHARALFLSAPENEIIESWVNGIRLGGAQEARYHGDRWILSYVNVPADGIELKLLVKGPGTLKLIVVDRSSGLPETPGQSLSPRPADSMSYHSGDTALVRRSFVF
jgi:hypothetical protein